MGRLRDDRGNRREHDRANGGERYDRDENSPSRDGENPDSPRYEAYGGPGMRGMPLPPPVLMPVPGAGYVFLLSIFCNFGCWLIQWGIHCSFNLLYHLCLDLLVHLFLLHLRLQCVCSETKVALVLTKEMVAPEVGKGVQGLQLVLLP